ncbi:AsnC family transcriptional regulator [Halobacteriales archaeon QS_8_69_26]|nr:MAG: AsnC family transcriptional regulator [Halobacteriales archaeon QS_8_69_26]
MDDLDREILDVLRRDARTPYTEIADQLGISEGTVRNRVTDLEESGVIERFTVTTRTGNLRAMVEIDVAVDVDTDELAAVLADWDTVEFVWQVGGEEDIVVVVDAADTRQLNDLISRARDREEIVATKSRLILDERVG